MGRADDIRGIRDAVVAVSAIKPMMEKREKKTSASFPLIDMPRKQRFEWDEWISDVSEAVEMFIGMNIEVLPRMPWKKWYESGISAVVAAKNASQMYEDSKDDGSFDFSVDAKRPKRRISEQFPVGRDSYDQWFKKVVKRVEKIGSSLADLMDSTGITIEQIHDMYNAEYDPIQVANSILKSGSGKAIASETKLRKRMKSLEEFAAKLGMRKSQVQEQDDDEDDEEPEDEEEDLADSDDEDEEGEVEESEDGNKEGEEVNESNDIESYIPKAEKVVLPIPTGKPDLSHIDYHEEKAFAAQLGQAIEQVNAAVNGQEISAENEAEHVE